MRIISFCILVSISAFLSGCNKKPEKDKNVLHATFKTEPYVSFQEKENAFILASGDKPVLLLVDSSDYPGVLKVAKLFQEDIHQVTGVNPILVSDRPDSKGQMVIIGTLGRSKYIDQLVKNGLLEINDLEGKWETSLIQVIENPFPGVQQALVVAGSDKRGTIFGMFDISAQIGVSPWYWWADVPVQEHTDIFIRKGRYNLGEPKVRYRGIFINDEEPALGNWVRETFGGFNVQFYEKVFELILRMKGNLLWPAMWGKAFAADDTLNPEIADEYGIVINYSHHEPMMRSHREWTTDGKGEWNYETNKDNLQTFWREGIERNQGYESIVTIGMRGDGDEPMSTDRNIETLSAIIRDQREIIEDITQGPANETPQIWALYKEVQEYYDMGMRVPDDITLLYCDDNWGNIRRVPGDQERQHTGGTGLYYHFDYVGGPRSYKWINSNSLPKIWHQNKLAYEFGIDKFWIVNVGDIKPMELPIQFYLDLAWDPCRFGPEQLDDYLLRWCEQQFGNELAPEIAMVLKKHSQYISRRKPELLNENTFSFTRYNEFERVVKEYRDLASESRSISAKIPEDFRDAYFQLVQYPVEATSNLYNLYFAVAENRNYHTQKRYLTNLMADSVRYYFRYDSTLAEKYHNVISQGKWNHMMSQTKIGYTSWNDPRKDKMPEVFRINNPSESLPGIYVSGEAVNNVTTIPSIIHLDNLSDQSHYFELYNKGILAFNYSIQAENEWVKMDAPLNGEIMDQKRFNIKIDWDEAPKGESKSKILVTAYNKSYTINLLLTRYPDEQVDNFTGYIENKGVISINATGFKKQTYTSDLHWITIPGMGRTTNGITLYPFMFKELDLDTAPGLEYEIGMDSSGSVMIYLYFSATNNFLENTDLKYAISYDKKSMKVSGIGQINGRRWNKMVSENVLVTVEEIEMLEAGKHTLQFKMLSPGLVLEKIVIDTGGMEESYLGVPVFSQNETL